ncbi:MAG: M48 family metalloprotease [Nitrospirae bacterium]|nr:M48 family metalloprotease [Nitrospirota bacterium]
MEKLYYIGLLFLNFTILNIFISLILFFISFITRIIVSSVYIRSRLFFTSIVAPTILAIFIVGTSFVPPVLVKSHDGPMPCLNKPYCYIFSFIPEFSLFKVAMTAAVILVLMSAICSVVSLAGYFRMRREIGGLANLSGTELYSALNFANILNNAKVKIIDTPLMFSFVWGYLSGIIVISTGVLKSLSPDELNCVLSHEASHYRRKDNFLKGLMILCRNTLTVFPHVHLLFRWWREEIELIGDEAAVLKTGRPMDVASAILKMQMTTGTNSNWHLDNFATGFISSLKSNSLTTRVERLIAINDSRITPGNVRLSLIPSETAMIAGLAFLCPLLFGIIYEIDPLILHCYLEKLTSVL